MYRKIWTAVLAASGMGWDSRDRTYYVNLDLTVTGQPEPNAGRRIHAQFTPAQARSLADSLNEYAARVETYGGGS